MRHRCISLAGSVGIQKLGRKNAEKQFKYLGLGTESAGATPKNCAKLKTRTDFFSPNNSRFMKTLNSSKHVPNISEISTCQRRMFFMAVNSPRHLLLTAATNLPQRSRERQSPTSAVTLKKNFVIENNRVSGWAGQSVHAAIVIVTCAAVLSRSVRKVSCVAFSERPVAPHPLRF